MNKKSFWMGVVVGLVVIVVAFILQNSFGEIVMESAKFDYGGYQQIFDEEGNLVGVHRAYYTTIPGPYQQIFDEEGNLVAPHSNHHSDVPGRLVGLGPKEDDDPPVVPPYPPEFGNGCFLDLRGCTGFTACDSLPSEAVERCCFDARDCKTSNIHSIDACMKKKCRAWFRGNPGGIKDCIEKVEGATAARLKVLDKAYSDCVVGGITRL
jgi:hypothetical protein